MSDGSSNRDGHRIDRRKFLAATGAAAITTGFAGCTGGGSDGGGGGGDGDGDGGGSTPTATQSATPSPQGTTAAAEGSASELKEQYGITEPDYEVEDKLIILQWSGYWPTYFVPNFQKIFGVDVSVSFYNSNPALFNKVRSLGKGNVDLIFPSGNMVYNMTDQDILAPIDLGKVPNYDNLLDRFKNPRFDPGDDAHSVAFNWGYTAIGNNTEVTGGELPQTWDVMWDEDFKGSITMHNSVRAAFAVAMYKLGYSINTTDPAKIKEAKELLLQQKPLLKAYDSANVRTLLRNGEASPCQAWNGQMWRPYFAMMEDGETPIQPILPEEGYSLWTDSGAIVKDAPHPNAAHAFINYYLNTKVHADLTQWLRYPVLLENEKQYRTDEESFENPKFSPSGDLLENTQYFLPLGDARKKYNEAWTRIKNA